MACGPVSQQCEYARYLYKVEIARCVKMRRAQPVQPPEHFAVAALLFLQLPQSRRDMGRPWFSQQCLENRLSHGDFEENDLFVEIQGVELVVAEFLLVGELVIGVRVEERSKFFRNEPFPAVNRWRRRHANRDRCGHALPPK